MLKFTDIPPETHINTEVKEDDSYTDNTISDDEFYEGFKATISKFQDPEKEITNHVQTMEPDLLRRKYETIKHVNDLGAETIVTISDSVMVWVLADMIAKTGDHKKYKATKEELTNLTVIAQEMMPKDKSLMPVWMQFILLVGSIYGKKFNTAFADLKISELEANNRILEAQKVKSDEEIRNLQFLLKKKKVVAELKKVQRKQMLENEVQQQINNSEQIKPEIKKPVFTGKIVKMEEIDEPKEKFDENELNEETENEHTE